MFFFVQRSLKTDSYLSGDEKAKLPGLFSYVLHKFPFRITINVCSHTQHSLKQTFIKINRSKGSGCLCLGNTKLPLFLLPWVMWLVICQKALYREDSLRSQQKARNKATIQPFLFTAPTSVYMASAPSERFCPPPSLHVIWLWAAGHLEGSFFLYPSKT